MILGLSVVRITHLLDCVLQERKEAINHSSFPRALLFDNSLCLFVSFSTYQMRSSTLVCRHENTQSSLEARWRLGSHVRRTGSFQEISKLSSWSSLCTPMFLGQWRHLSDDVILRYSEKPGLLRPSVPVRKHISGVTTHWPQQSPVLLQVPDLEL